jgi:hypothetical protein
VIVTERASATLPATVETIVKSPIPNVPEKAQIRLEGAEAPYRELRFENTLTNDNGDHVSLQPGARVKVTVKAETKNTTPKS